MVATYDPVAGDAYKNALVADVKDFLDGIKVYIETPNSGAAIDVWAASKGYVVSWYAIDDGFLTVSVWRDHFVYRMTIPAKRFVPGSC